MLNIVMVKWGTKYSDDDYVELLGQTIYNIDINTKVKYHIYTDSFDWDASDIDAMYPRYRKTAHFIPEELHLRGVWPKLSMFREDFPIKGKTLYFDLDTIIDGPIDELISSIDWSRLTMVDSHWKPKDIVRPHNYDVLLNSSVMAFDTTNPEIHKIWNHFQNTGLRDYFLRKYSKGIDRFIWHERKHFQKDLIDYFDEKFIRSFKYEKRKQAPVVTFEEVNFGSASIIYKSQSN